MNEELLAALLAPISDMQPAGEDQSYSRIFDEIREARRADDPSLAQGDWATGVKVAEWSKVRTLCETAFKTQTKDLQLAAWYIEAMTRQEGFAGLAFSLRFTAEMVARYWETLYPEFDPHDFDERVGKLEWLNKQLPAVIREVPLTKAQEGGFGWFAWNESREVKNMGLRDPQLRENAIAEGKLSDERFDRSASSSGLVFYQKLVDDITAAREAFTRFDDLLENLLGHDAPGTSDIRNAIAACLDVAQSLFNQLGGGAASATPAPIAEESVTAQTAPQAVQSIQVSRPAGSLQSRADAVRALQDVARYFRQNEPHSPVSLLVERAARWADMPLEAWLASVIKDDSTLGQLRDLLDIRVD